MFEEFISIREYLLKLFYVIDTIVLKRIFSFITIDKGVRLRVLKSNQRDKKLKIIPIDKYEVKNIDRIY